MSKIISFFSWLWNGVIKALAFITSGFGLVITTFTTLGASVATMYQQITTTGSSLAVASQGLEGALNGFDAVAGSMPDMAKWAMYILSLDILGQGLVAVAALILPIIILFFTFCFVTVPVIVTAYLLLRYSVWLATALFPKMYIPPMVLALKEAPVELPTVIDTAGGRAVITGGGFLDSNG